MEITYKIETTYATYSQANQHMFLEKEYSNVSQKNINIQCTF